VWLTPPEILAAVGPFDLDPCAPVDRPWPMAAEHYTEADDGLSLPWYGMVWCNPPFGPEAGAWLDRCAEHGNAIALVPARTETRWFVRAIWGRANAVLFLHGRPHFHRPNGDRAKANSGAPICLVAYGEQALERLFSCGLPGSITWSWYQAAAVEGRVPEDPTAEGTT
jgi:hypothetical protein